MKGMGMGKELTNKVRNGPRHIHRHYRRPETKNSQDRHNSSIQGIPNSLKEKIHSISINVVYKKSSTSETVTYTPIQTEVGENPHTHVDTILRFTFPWVL